MERYILLLAFGFLLQLDASPGLAGPIHEAARSGDVERTQQLLEQGVDLEERDGTQETPLIAAALAGERKVAELLIENGADIGARNNRGLTPLHAAAYGGHVEVVELLIANEAMLNDAENQFEITPLHAAAEENRIGVVEALLTAKVNLDKPEINGYTPLSRAGFRENWEVVILLLKAGAVCQPADKVGDWLYGECTKRTK